MTESPQVEIWESGRDHPPPPALSVLLIGDERLLWSAIVPSARLHVRWLWVVMICFSLAGYLLFEIWGQMVTEYCGTSKSSRCSYHIAWLIIAFCTFLAVYLLQLIWRNYSAPWSYFYGVSSKRALLMRSYKPSKVYSAQLDQNTAAIDWFGSVRFGGSRAGLSFAGLDDRDAGRAVYWANKGRFRIDSSIGPAP